MMKRIFISLFTALLVFLSCASLSTPSLALDLVDTTKECSVTITYKHKETAYPNLNIKFYKIASCDEKFTFELTEDFREYPVNIYGISSQTEWRNVTETLTSYAIADNITPYAENKTDMDGTVKFENLAPGMYLTLGVKFENPEDEGEITTFESFITTVPDINDNGSYNYNISAFPKCEHIVPVPDVEYKIVKQWKDGGYVDRPQSVTVEIYKDSSLYESVVLSAENNWLYSWVAPEDGSRWYVVEKDIHSGYTVDVSREDNTFIVTNTHTNDGSIPQTGDSVSVIVYILCLSFAGMILIIAAMLRKNKENEKA